jgi:hypothetical protein
MDSPVATLHVFDCWTTVPSRPRWLWTCNTHNLHVTSIEHTTIFEIEAGFACCFDGAPQNEPRCRPKHIVEKLETYIRLSANPWTLMFGSSRTLHLPSRKIYPRGKLRVCFSQNCPLRSFRSMGTNRWCCYSRYAVS